jgi:uncharacterized membrane protein
MGWNTFLALIPPLLALPLFRARLRPGLLWYLAFAAFVLFLPNSAYVLTDIVQFIRRVRQPPFPSAWVVAVVLVPQYAAFMLVGLEAHVLSLMRFGSYLRSFGYGRYVPAAEVMLNLAASCGIYLGRFRRFNSWDVMHDSSRIAAQMLADFSTAAPWRIVAVTFGLLCLLYYSMRTINRSLVLAWKMQRTNHVGGPAAPYA